MSSRSNNGQEATMAGVVERNIRALLRHRRSQERTKRAQDRIADAITRFTGSMTFVYVHVIVFGLWIVVNLRAASGIVPAIAWMPSVPSPARGQRRRTAVTFP